MHLGTQHCKLHSLFVFSKRVYTHCPHDTTWGSIFTLEKRVNAINETEIILISVRRKTLRWETLETLLKPQQSELHSLFVFSGRVYTRFPHGTTWGLTLHSGKDGKSKERNRHEMVRRQELGQLGSWSSSILYPSPTVCWRKGLGPSGGDRKVCRPRKTGLGQRARYKSKGENCSCSLFVLKEETCT